MVLGPSSHWKLTRVRIFSTAARASPAHEAEAPPTALPLEGRWGKGCQRSGRPRAGSGSAPCIPASELWVLGSGALVLLFRTCSPPTCPFATAGQQPRLSSARPLRRWGRPTSRGAGTPGHGKKPCVRLSPCLLRAVWGAPREIPALKEGVLFLSGRPETVESINYKNFLIRHKPRRNPGGGPGER